MSPCIGLDPSVPITHKTIGLSHTHNPPPPTINNQQEGKQIEKIVAMTNWDYYEAVERFQRILDATGINKTLKKRGAKEGGLKRVDGSATWASSGVGGG